LRVVNSSLIIYCMIRQRTPRSIWSCPEQLHTWPHRICNVQIGIDY